MKSAKVPSVPDEKSTIKLPQGATPYQYLEINGKTIKEIDGGIIDEGLVSIYVNVVEVATVMCSPLDEDALAIGFLYNEHLIEQYDDIAHLQVNASRTVIDIFLTHGDVQPSRRMVITSGCGGGVASLSQQYDPLTSDFQTDVDVITYGMRQLRGVARLYNAVRGVHTAILSADDKLLVSAEDVGRHNTIDKLAGKALQQNISTHDKILFATGRISSEMVHKARRMAIPLVVSRTAPTKLAIELATSWNICLVGYVRQNSLRVYTMRERIKI